MKSRITAAVIFLCSAMSVVWLLRSPLGEGSVAAAASALALVFASAGVFLRPRLSYCVGLASGLVALHWFARTEFRDFPALNSWILFNLPDGNPNILFAKLRVLFVVTVVASIACSATRLLPAKWVLRKIPIRERTWPTFGVCFLVTSMWYGVSVSPYRIPLLVNAVEPELTVLHVGKKGMQLHETAISTHRDGRVYIRRNDRRLLQYQFAVRGGEAVLPVAIIARVRALTQSTQLRDLHTPPATALRNWHAEGWYIRRGRNALAFTSEYGVKPPTEVVDLFHDLETVVSAEKQLGSSHDICMGFCYDPLAGLGLAYVSDRCNEHNGTRCK